MSLSRRVGSKASRTLVQSSGRRFASHDSHNFPQPSAKTSFGKGAYITLGAIPTSYLVYYISRPSEDGSEPRLTRIIRSFDSWQDEFKKRNELRTDMLDQAAKDKILFYNTSPTMHYASKFDDALNTGSPFNVPAGFYANMDKAIAHYQEKNAETQAKIQEKVANPPEPRIFWATEKSLAEAKDQKQIKGHVV